MTNKKELILDSRAIQDRVRELGQEISRDYCDQPLVIIGILKGAFIFMADLVRAIDIDLPLVTDFIQVSSYGSKTTSSGTIKLVKEPSTPLADINILIVEDIVDSGLTKQWLINYFKTKQARSVKICSLIDKAERREIDICIDYLGFDIPKGFLVGYGLDYNEQYRHLPEIFHLRQDNE